MRLFFALWPPPEAAARLSALAQLAAGRTGGKPTREETIHLTLAFLGEVPEARLPDLLGAAHGVAASSFELTIDRLGYWSKNTLLWAGASSPPAGLGDLAERLKEALLARAFTVDTRAFTPHITLVRKLPAVAEASAPEPIEAITWRCASYALVRSVSSDAGARYETIHAFALAAR